MLQDHDQCCFSYLAWRIDGLSLMTVVKPSAACFTHGCSYKGAKRPQPQSERSERQSGGPGRRRHPSHQQHLIVSNQLKQDTRTIHLIEWKQRLLCLALKQKKETNERSKQLCWTKETNVCRWIILSLAVSTYRSLLHWLFFLFDRLEGYEGY